MKKVSIAFLTAAALLPLIAAAQAVPPVTVGGVPSQNVNPDVNVYTIMLTVLNWAFGLLVVLAALFIIYAAFVYLTSGGDTEKTESAKKYIIYAVVAIVVAALARAVVVIVRGLLSTGGA